MITHELGRLGRPKFFLRSSEFAITRFAQNCLLLTLLLLSLLAGGGQGGLGDTGAQLLALVLLTLTAWRVYAGHVPPPPRSTYLVLLPLLLPIMQLLPLPDWLWLWPDARAALGEQMAWVGVETPGRWTLNPIAAERALFWLVPGYAMFFSSLQASLRMRMAMLVVVLIVACGSVFLGVAQLQGGEHSPLRFYSVTNIHYAVGFYANRNHFAGQLALALPFALIGSGWAALGLRRGDPRVAIYLVLGAVVGSVLLLGIALASSRAAMGLAGVAMLLCLIALVRYAELRLKRRYLMALLGLAVLLTLFAALLGNETRFAKNPFADARWQYASVAIQAAGSHAPLGAGLGTFQEAYQVFDIDTLGASIINHAHSDLIELWLDGGWLLPLIAVPVLLAFVRMSRRVWQLENNDYSSDARLLALAAWIALFGVLLHELVDYPLRTTAHLSLLGLLVALVLPMPTTQRVRNVDAGSH